MGKANHPYILADTKTCLITTQEEITLQNSRPPPYYPPRHTHSSHSRHMEWGHMPLSHDTYQRHPILYCYYWNLSPSESILHIESCPEKSGTCTQPIHKYCPETDIPLWSYTEGSHPSRRHTTAFWGRRVDEGVMLALPVSPYSEMLQGSHAAQRSTQEVETP